MCKPLLDSNHEYQLEPFVFLVGNKLLDLYFSKLRFLNFSRNYFKQPDSRSFRLVFSVFVDMSWSNHIFWRLDVQYDVRPYKAL